MTGSRMPSASSTAYATSRRVGTGASGTNHAVTRAARGLGRQPGLAHSARTGERDQAGGAPGSSAPGARRSSRPTKLVSGLCRRTAVTGSLGPHVGPFGIW